MMLVLGFRIGLLRVKVGIVYKMGFSVIVASEFFNIMR